MEVVAEVMRESTLGSEPLPRTEVVIRDEAGRRSREGSRARPLPAPEANANRCIAATATATTFAARDYFKGTVVEDAVPRLMKKNAAAV